MYCSKQSTSKGKIRIQTHVFGLQYRYSRLLCNTVHQHMKENTVNFEWIPQIIFSLYSYFQDPNILKPFLRSSNITICGLNPTYACSSVREQSKGERELFQLQMLFLRIQTQVKKKLQRWQCFLSFVHLKAVLGSVTSQQSLAQLFILSHRLLSVQCFPLNVRL